MTPNNTAHALLYLMKCALYGTTPEAMPELDYEALYKLSSSQSVVAIVAMALESAGLLTEQYTTAENVKEWKEARVKAVRKNVLMDAEREQLLAHLEEKGVWYIPLKGVVLQDLYPKMGMRQMSDNDIWYDASYRHELKQYMEQRGYKTVYFNIGKDDVYEKAPVYHFEFHATLFFRLDYPEWVAYCEQLKARLIKDEDKEYGYHFTDEDFYIYFILHAYVHYAGEGIGIRLLSDIYVYLKKKGQQMDWTYVFGELKRLGVAEFEVIIRELSNKLFGENECDLEEKERELLAKMLADGTYGTLENYVENRLEKLQEDGSPVTAKTKIKYTLQRLFPNYEFMKEYFPFCRKHPWSMPIFWVYRWFRAATVSRKKTGRELKTILKGEGK